MPSCCACCGGTRPGAVAQCSLPSKLVSCTQCLQPSASLRASYSLVETLLLRLPATALSPRQGVLDRSGPCLLNQPLPCPRLRGAAVVAHPSPSGFACIALAAPAKLLPRIGPGTTLWQCTIAAHLLSWPRYCPQLAPRANCSGDRTCCGRCCNLTGPARVSG